MSWFNAKAMSFNDVAIAYVKGNAYRIHFWYMSKDDAISIMNNSNLIDKKGVYKKWMSPLKNLLSKQTETWY